MEEWGGFYNPPPSICLQGLNDDTAAFQASISDRLGLFVRNITTAVAAVIICESFGGFGWGCWGGLLVWVGGNGEFNPIVL